MNETEKWDRAAGNYQEVFLLGPNEYNASLLSFWKDNGMLFPGARVLDIGCGVGKYGVYLAEMGYDVTLTDISGEMLRRARENMARFRTHWTVYPCDFHRATGKELVFAEGFDLSISTMSPAVCDEATVRKMSGMTRGWCFLARFFDWKQPFRDRLMRDMGLEPVPSFHDLREEGSSLIRAVCNAGYVPHVKFTDYRWSDRRTSEQMAEYMVKNCFADADDPAAVYESARRAAAGRAGDDGTVCDEIITNVIWIWWNTKMDPLP